MILIQIPILTLILTPILTLTPTDTSGDKFGHMNHIISSTNETAYYLHKSVVEKCRNDMELRSLMEEEYDQLLLDREELRKIMGCRGSGSESDPFTYLPVNIDRLIWNAQRQFRIKMDQPTTMHPRFVNEIP
jgi:hypothetical protein